MRIITGAYTLKKKDTPAEAMLYTTISIGRRIVMRIVVPASACSAASSHSAAALQEQFGNLVHL